MANANVSNLGQIQGAGDTTALWLTLFAGEVLTAFEIAVKLKDKIRTRSISGAKSAQFPATYRVNTRIHTPGTEIDGQNLQANQVLVTLDDLVISDTFVAEIDELKNQYDVRSIYANEHGRSQALYFDRVISDTLVASARNTTALFTGDGAGTTLIDNVNISSTADFTASGDDLISGVNLAKQTMDINQVPVETLPVYALFKPVQWYLVANSDKNINRFYNDDKASLQRQVLSTVSDIQIIKSIAPNFGYNVTPYNSVSNVLGIVANADPYVIGTNTPAANLLPYGLPTMANYPTKYQSDQTKTVGLVWVEAAAALLTMLGITMESVWDPRRQGTLMVAKQALGAGSLRSKCVVELQRH